MYNILICDDDPDILSALEIYLKGEGYRPIPTRNGQEALLEAEREEIHAAVLDVMMPGLDGIGATVRLRERYNFPIILLTAKGEDGDKVLGLTVGADDYVVKPFSPVELLARIKSQLRRYTALGSMEKKPDVLSVGGILLDDRAKNVTRDGEAVNLTPIEYAILKLLMGQPGRVFASREIYEKVWNDNTFANENLVAVHIRHLREKLEIDPADPRLLRVVWGQGYSFGGNDVR